MIFQVNLVLNRTVVESDWCFDNLLSRHLMVLNSGHFLIGQLSCDIISCLSVKPWLGYEDSWCNLSTVTVKQSFIASQIVGCPVILPKLVLLESWKSSLYIASNCWLRFGGICKPA